MPDPVFYVPETVLSLERIAVLADVPLPAAADPAISILRVAALENAGPDDLAYMDNARYLKDFQSTKAGVLLVSERFAAQAPSTAICLICKDPYRAYARVLAELYPSAIRPASTFADQGVATGGYVHTTARLESGVTVDPGAVIGPRVEIGTGTVVGANAVIGPDVRIGRGCAIGPNASILNALIGNQVIIHPGARIGQDGFGFVMGQGGHMKVPQIGRVIIQDKVEIGSNTTIDRGSGRDTIIGEGTKIDNLVQIAHNVVIGRHCIIVAQVGISGSTVLEDYVVLAGQAGLIGHLRIGTGAQVAASSGVMRDIPAGAKWGGTPAKPAQEWLREVAYLNKVAMGRASKVSQENATSKSSKPATSDKS